jgi:hypothetical protein
MLKNILKFAVLMLLLSGLPILGIILTGQSVEKYAEFPTNHQYTVHSPFSCTVFIIISIIVIIFIFPIIFYSIRYFSYNKIAHSENTKMPLWGKLSISATVFFWIIAWSDFDFLAKLREYTFFPLWFSFTISVNALIYRKTGKSPITEQPVKFLFLFPISAVFWWYFEFINGFVNNWYYIGADYSRHKYFLLSTLAFSTVLPAVSSISTLLSDYSWIKNGFEGIWKIQNPMPELSALLVFTFSGIGLVLIGIFPEYLFPLVWVSPLLIIISMQIFFNEDHIFSGIKDGNWNVVISAAIAALICGLFWEMWNFNSMPKWHYSIPFIHRYLVFEMPVLGFSGYLPFGLLCISISKMLIPDHD